MVTSFNPSDSHIKAGYEIQAPTAKKAKIAATKTIQIILFDLHFVFIKKTPSQKQNKLPNFPYQIRIIPFF